MNNTPRLYFIGDTHGHFRELIGLMHTLYNQADLQPERDILIMAGDYCDGGPDTRKVVQWCIDMAAKYPHWVFLKGNHSDMLLDAVRYDSCRYGSFYHWWDQGGAATAASYLSAKPDLSDYERAILQPADYIPQAHLDWLDARPLYHETDKYIFVHAGLRPGIPLAEQDREDMLWIRESFFEARFNFGKTVVFGHTPMKEPLIVRELVSPEPVKPIVAIGIDTMSFERGKLTAVELSGDAPVFYHQEAVEGPWPASVRCRYSEPPRLEDYPF